MRHIVNEFDVFKFSELSPSSQGVAVSQFSDVNVDYEWWDCTYEDAANIGIKITEFDIDRASYCHGKFLFSHAEVAKKILSEHGETCETYKTADKFLKEYLPLALKLDENYSTSLNDTIEDLQSEFEKSILEDYRIMLSQEYEYKTTREAIVETIIANEYEFLETGKWVS